MKRALVILILTPSAAAQTSGKHIALTANSKVASGEDLNGLNNKKCSGITLTGDPTKADYMVEVNQIAATGKMCVDLQNANSNSACPKTEYSGTLFSVSGDVLFQTKTHSYSVVTLKSAVEDLCKAIAKQK